MSRVAAELSYFRRAQGHFTTTDNLDVTPTDFQPYCVTAPRDPRLPGGGGNQICGLYDIVPTKFGVATNNIVDFVDNYGKQSEVFNGIDFAINARIRADLFVTGGFATGNTHFNNCDAFVDNPRTDYGISATLPVAGTAATPGTGLIFNYCDFDTSWLSQVKADRHLHAAVAVDPVRRRAAEPARTDGAGELEHHAGRRRRRHAGPGALGRREHVALRAARQAGHDVHAAPHAARPARVEELQPERAGGASR